MTTLLEFLNARRVTKGGEWNVTGMSKNDKGVYFVSDEDYDQFLSVYSTAVMKMGVSSSLLERHTAFSPILIDLDFKYNYEKIKRRRFEIADIKRFIGLYAEVFHRFICISGPLRFFVMLKSGPVVEKGLLKDGVHIVCPDVSLPPAIMSAIRLVLLDSGAIETCFTGLVNPVADVFDESVIQRNNWFLYGAGKPDSGVYSVAACFTSTNLGITMEERVDLPSMDLVRLFSIKRDTSSEYTINDDMKDMWTSCEKGFTVAGPSGSVDDAALSAVFNVVGGTWSVTSCTGGYKLLYSSRMCLVDGSRVHSTSGHSCIFVSGKGATACCFSHGKRPLVEAGIAAWRLLTGSEVTTDLADDVIDDVIDDVYACRKFVELMGDELHREGDQVYVFDRLTGLWAANETAMFCAVHCHRRALMLSLSGDKVYNYGGNTRNIRNMLVHLRSLLSNETFITDNLNKSLKFLLFKNGIFNIETQEFALGFNKKMVFTARINRDFPDVRDTCLEAEINRLLFILPFENAGVGDYLKMRLARSIAGCYLDKKFVCALGDADCSKGTITKAMRYAFDEYVIEWNANNLKYNSRNSMDEAKKLAWIFNILDARLAISNECRMDGVAMDGNLIKTLASGGDNIDARKNFMEQVRLEIHTSFIYLGNDMPAITPKDSGIATRLRVVRFVKRFVENPTLPNELQADGSIKTKLASLEWRNAVFWLIMDAYRLPTSEPTEVLEETQEWIPSESGKFREVLEEMYAINVAGDGFVTSRELAEFFKGRNMNMSDTKVGRELAKIGLVKSDKKIGGKTTKVWSGICRNNIIE
jgi:hypothetical protein